MKKKSKLIATLSSLGLALAMMVFAVYAATSVTFKVTTNVSFTATKHVQASIVAKDTGKLASAPTDASYTVPAKTGAEQTIGVKTDGTDNGSITDVEFVGAELDATNKYYGYQIIITNNDDENALSISVTQPQISGQGYKVSWTGTSALSIASNKSLTITCLVEITDLAGNKVTVNKDDLTLDVQLGEIEYEVDYDLFNFTLSDDETYYTAELKTDKVVSGRLVIPGEYNGKTVKSIRAVNYNNNGNGNLDNVSSIVILEGVKEIGVESFILMNNLVDLYLPDSLETASWENGVGGAFESCSKLKSVSVGNNLIDVACAFDCMESNREDGSLYITSRDGSTKYLARGPKTGTEKIYIVENGTKSIFCDFGCFSNGDIIIPNSVEFFGSRSLIDHYVNIFLETSTVGQVSIIYDTVNCQAWKGIYYYSEDYTNKSGAISEQIVDGRKYIAYTYGFWHYDENGKPEIWE